METTTRNKTLASLPASDRMMIAGAVPSVLSLTLVALLLLTMGCHKVKDEDDAAEPAPIVAGDPTIPDDPASSAGPTATLKWRIDKNRVLSFSSGAAALPAARYSLAPAPLDCASDKRTWHAISQGQMPLPNLLGGDYRLCLASDQPVKFSPTASEVVSIDARASFLIATDSGLRVYDDQEVSDSEFSQLKLERRTSLSDGVSYFVDTRGKWFRGRWTEEKWVESEMKSELAALNFVPLGRTGFLRVRRSDDGRFVITDHDETALPHLQDTALVTAAKQLTQSPIVASSDGQSLHYGWRGKSLPFDGDLPPSCTHISDLKVVTDGTTVTSLLVCQTAEEAACTLAILRHDQGSGKIEAFAPVDRHPDHCDPFLQRELLLDRDTPVVYYHRQNAEGILLFAARVSASDTPTEPILLSEAASVASVGIILVHGGHEIAWGQPGGLSRLRWLDGELQISQELQDLANPRIVAASNKFFKDAL